MTAYEGDTGGLELSEEAFAYTSDYGNIESYRFKDLTEGGRSYTTEIGYADKRYGTVNRVTVKGDDGQTYREAEATYTNTFTPWAMSTLTRKLDDGQTAHFKFEYDHFGNLTRKESDSTFFTYTYERRYNMYPERVEDAFGYRSEMEDYDYRYGIPLTVRDMNGYTVKYHTDGYGRVDTIVAPNEQSAGNPFTIAYQYVNGNDYKTRYAVTNHFDVQHPDDPVTTVTHVDGLGRPLQVKKEAEIDGSVRYIVSGKAEYDALGRTVRSYHPSTCAAGDALKLATFSDRLLNSSSFDAIDRPLTQTLPGDASGAESTTATAYRQEDGLAVTTVTAPNGNQTSTYTNGAGQTVRMVRDLDGKPVETRFFFDPVGQLDSLIDARGSVTRYTYDMAGRKLSVGHPSAGLTTFKYDVAGNVLEKETENLRAEKKKIEYSYEKNRLKRVTYPNHPENNVTYTYGGVNADFNRVGRVALVEDGSGATEFFYGRMGEVVKQRRTLVIPNVAVATYTTKWKYDSQNRILEMEYPDEEKISYLYNRGGLLRQVSGEKSHKYRYIDSIAYDAYEQKVYQKYGNGTETRYSYSDNRRRLAGMTVESPVYQSAIM
ncbi:MAG: RHS repeat protein, partial [Paludibacteraceae bacterium]|nr:RHS repeat protein [Paludibacteraceae bacterium]